MIVSLASEVTTWQEGGGAGGDSATRFRSRVRTNAAPDRLRRRLEILGLLSFAESIERYETNWQWTGSGQGYEILWREATTFADLLPLARL